MLDYAIKRFKPKAPVPTAWPIQEEVNRQVLCEVVLGLFEARILSNLVEQLRVLNHQPVQTRNIRHVVGVLQGEREQLAVLQPAAPRRVAPHGVSHERPEQLNAVERKVHHLGPRHVHGLV